MDPFDGGNPKSTQSLQPLESPAEKKIIQQKNFADLRESYTPPNI